jgi:glycosyltransferase involved in cell wall biosynthesis
MPAFNSERTIVQTIISIRNQSHPDWELLVLDDGSSDRTVEVAKSFDDPRICVIADGVHRGLPEQLNRAVDLARGKYFARMDADDIAYPNRLRTQLQFLEANAEVDLVSGWMVVFRSNGTVFGARRGPLDHGQISAHPWRGIPMAHPTWTGRTDWFRQNPYRTDAVRMEDLELLFRTYRNSRFASVPEIVLGYREDSLSLRKILVARRHTCRMMIRHMSDQRDFAVCLLGVIGQVGKALVDIVAIGAGLDYRLLRSRAGGLQHAEEVEWHAVWQQVQRDSVAREHHMVITR